MSLTSLGFEAVLIGETMYENHVEGPVRTGWDLGSPGMCVQQSLVQEGSAGPHTHPVILLLSLQQVPSCLRV